jgi:hypothetical protein
MRTGLLERAPLPSTPKAAKTYAKTQFLLTDAGVQWIELLNDSGEAAALDALLGRLWIVHPQLADYLRFLATVDTFFVPNLSWSTVFPDGSGPEGRDGYVSALVDRVEAAIESENPGWAATKEEIESAIASYTTRADARRSPRSGAGPPTSARATSYGTAMKR